jgi:hypothetical protein
MTKNHNTGSESHGNVTGRLSSPVIPSWDGIWEDKNAKSRWYCTGFLLSRDSYQRSRMAGLIGDQSLRSCRAASELSFKPSLTLIAQDLTDLHRGYHNGFLEVCSNTPPPSGPLAGPQPVSVPSQQRCGIHLHILDLLIPEGI